MAQYKDSCAGLGEAPREPGTCGEGWKRNSMREVKFSIIRCGTAASGPDLTYITPDPATAAPTHRPTTSRPAVAAAPAPETTRARLR